MALTSSLGKAFNAGPNGSSLVALRQPEIVRPRGGLQAVVARHVARGRLAMSDWRWRYVAVGVVTGDAASAVVVSGGGVDRRVVAEWLREVLR